MPVVPLIIVDRIRRPAPEGCAVLPGSLPVVAFGDALHATTATVSLNPSWIEFQTKRGEWLLGHRRRLASLLSVGVHDPRELDDAAVSQVLGESDRYFQGPNWYRAWFHWLEGLLSASGAGSYLEGSACHLDLVQWATKPAQRNLPASTWNYLVEQDRAFLHWQLTANRVKRVLINGAACVRWMRSAGLVTRWEESLLSFRTGAGARAQLKVFLAEEADVLFVGWNRPLAGAVPAAGREALRSWVASAMGTG